MYDNGTPTISGVTLLEALDTRRNEVWRARRAGPVPSLVAVKLLHPAYEPIVPRWPSRRHRTLKRILSAKAGWVPLLDHGYTSDGRRFVMTPLYAESLMDRFKHEDVEPWHETARLMAQAADIVAAAHNAGYAFGHLRPSSILVDERSQVRVAAYGMSTRRFDDGTAQFTAPEMYGDERPLPASDVFSLSLILASALLGRPVDHREDRPTVVEEVGAFVPDQVLEIVDYGLSINLPNRFADAAKMARALTAALSESEPDNSTVPAEAGTDQPADESPEIDWTVSTASPWTLDDMTTSGNGPDSSSSTLSGPLDDLLDTVGEHPGEATLDHEAGLAVRQEIKALLDEIEADDLPGVELFGEPEANGDETDTAGKPDNDDHEQPGMDSVAPSSAPPAPSPRSTAAEAEPEVAVHERRGLPAESAVAIVEPSRALVVADNLTHFLAVHRRRLASSIALTGITGAIGVAVLIGAADLMSRDVTISGDTPASSTTVVETPAVERSSPLNNQAPIEGARSLSPDDLPAERPARRARTATATPATKAAIDGPTATSTSGVTTPSTDDDGDDSDPTTSSVGQSTATTGTSTSSGKGKKTTTTAGATSQPPTTIAEPSTTAQPPTTEATSTTRKGKGRPKRP